MPGLDAIIIALLGFGFASSIGPNDYTPDAVRCERIDMGGYYNFADPTCPIVEADEADRLVEDDPA